MDQNTPNGISDNRDQNVLSFMMQLVQEKHGDDIQIDFLNSESDRLYNIFGDKLVSFFEPQLSEEQKKSFDQMIAANKTQDDLMNFLIESISDLEEQIMQVLVQFREEYLQNGMPSNETQS